MLTSEISERYRKHTDIFGIIRIMFDQIKKKIVLNLPFFELYTAG